MLPDLNLGLQLELPDQQTYTSISNARHFWLSCHMYFLVRLSYMLIRFIITIWRRFVSNFDSLNEELWLFLWFLLLHTLPSRHDILTI